jgi:hypothetical protein
LGRRKIFRGERVAETLMVDRRTRAEVKNAHRWQKLLRRAVGQ